MQAKTRPEVGRESGAGVGSTAKPRLMVGNDMSRASTHAQLATRHRCQSTAGAATHRLDLERLRRARVCRQRHPAGLDAGDVLLRVPNNQVHARYRYTDVPPPATCDSRRAMYSPPCAVAQTHFDTVLRGQLIRQRFVSRARTSSMANLRRTALMSLCGSMAATSCNLRCAVDSVHDLPAGQDMGAKHRLSNMRTCSRSPSAVPERSPADSPLRTCDKVAPAVRSHTYRRCVRQDTRQ